jgi:hypothetical protein
MERWPSPINGYAQLHCVSPDQDIDYFMECYLGAQLVWTNPDTQSSFTSLTIPLSSILSSRFEQPVFGANYLALTIKPTADGGLTEGTTLEIRFLDTGMFKFVSVLAKTREKAIFMRRRSIEDEENLRE